MNNYELVVVLDGKATTAKKKAIQTTVNKLVKINMGKVLDVEDWGARELAYKIGKSETGAYLIFSLELGAEGAAGINSNLRLEENIIRYLLIKKEETKNGKKS